jgi:methylmalonyl-CoA carboxyltransferase 12S subunit
MSSPANPSAGPSVNPPGNPSPDGDKSLAAAVLALREEVARLADRIAALESAATAPPPAAPAPPPPAPELTEELILVITAAVAAYLGKKPYIRQIRLVTSPTWNHQGRVTIQGSHMLAPHWSGASP